MDKFPTGPGRVLRAVSGDPMSRPMKAPQFFNVVMEHIAWLGMLITHDGGCWFEKSQAIESDALEARVQPTYM